MSEMNEAECIPKPGICQAASTDRPLCNGQRSCMDIHVLANASRSCGFKERTAETQPKHPKSPNTLHCLSRRQHEESRW